MIQQQAQQFRTAVPVYGLLAYSPLLEVTLFSTHTEAMITQVTAKTTAQPVMASPNAAIMAPGLKEKFILQLLLLSTEQSKDQTAGDDGRNLTGNVDADGMHEQEVLVVFLQAHFVNDSS